MNGIYLHAAEEAGEPVLRAVATDGHRLASAETNLPDGAADMPGVIVPRKTVQELHKLIEETEAEIRITMSDAKIQFSFNGVVLTSKLIDGTFPAYEGVIPKGEYGGGEMIVWDRGALTWDEDPDEGIAKGKLLFTLRGYKLRDNVQTLAQVLSGAGYRTVAEVTGPLLASD